jgi:hypothetical protein
LEQIPDAKKAMGSDGFKPLSKAIETEFEEYVGPIRPDIENILDQLIECSDLAKTLTAGQTTATPSNNVQGSALAASEKQDELPIRDMRNIIKERIRDRWNRITPIHEFLKSDLQDLGPQFKEHFESVIDELQLKKTNPVHSGIVTHRHSLATIPHSKEQKRLAAGIRIKASDGGPIRAMNSSGNRVIVQASHNTPDDLLTSSERATIYHNLAGDFFGLADHVPMTSAFVNPIDRKIYHAVQSPPVAMHGHHHKLSPHYDDAVKTLAREGLLHKIAVMDYVLGHSNRHMSNMLIDASGEPHLLDNEDSFKSPNHPEYLHVVDGIHQILDIPTRDWIRKLDPKMLYAMCRHHGLPDKHAKETVSRLETAKNRLSNQSHISELYHEEN